MSEAFNEQELMERVDGDLEFLEETVEMLEEDSPPLVDQIREAAESGDAETLARCAHALKGILSNFCAAPAQAAALALERMGQKGVLDGAASAVDRIDEETTRVRLALREFLQAKTP